ncbi:MAG: hypothetical protein Q8910_17140, partial [Bacteroidota bacterium]|nr:hypothetical protein [Bacteroidota bacterium]
MKRLSIAYLILLGFIFSSGCTRKNFKFKPGDLLFQINESNSFTEAITGTTGNLRKYSFSHVAIISAEG